MKKRDSRAAAPATYRKAVNKVAKSLRVEPTHTRYPSEDFELVAGLIDPKSRERALDWYRRGLCRGFREAVVGGHLKVTNGVLTCIRKKVVIAVGVRFAGAKKKRKEFRFTANELGF
jgi:hypothetical protein